MTAVITTVATACVSSADVFLHPLLEDSQPTTGATRQLQARLLAKADSMCADCPLFTNCLYDAVVKHDVSGFVAGTTPKQREAMREVLGVTVEPEDFDTLAGVTTPNRQIDNAEVLRLRAANPHESLETIAHRLGCSLSTVKRHLRKARNGNVTPTLTVAPPTTDKVLDAYAQVVLERPAKRTAA